MQKQAEDNASNLFQKISISLPINKASYPRRLEYFIFKVKGYSLKFSITCHLVYLKLIASSRPYVSDM